MGKWSLELSHPTEKLNDNDSKYYDQRKSKFDEQSEDEKQKFRDDFKEVCDQYMETDSYKNGDTDTRGYRCCCEILEVCGGLSGWWIFFIIVIVIGCLATAGAAFWFFYLKRKMGGRDGENLEDTDSMENITKIDNSDIEISVDTY